MFTYMLFSFPMNTIHFEKCEWEWETWLFSGSLFSNSLEKELGVLY